jgi:hypothetical protein
LESIEYAPGPRRPSATALAVAITHKTILAQGLVIIFAMENAAAMTQRTGVRSPTSNDAEISKITPKNSR